MKKKLVAVLMAVGMLSLAACGKDPAEMVYLSDFDASDYVKLGEYKGVEVALTEPEVTEEEIVEYMDTIREAAAVSTPITDRAVEMGDIANIDYVGKLDGVAFEGGTAQGFDLTIGSGQFIPGFEEGVVGMEIGETKDIDMTFPDPYDNNPDLAGQPVVFTVTVNGINEQEIPELTDEFVAGLEREEFSTVEEFRAYVSNEIMEQKQTDYDNEKTNLTVEAVASLCEFKGAPSGMIDRMNTTLTNNIGSYASMYGMDIRSYVAAVYGGTEDEFQDTLLEQTELMAQQYIMMQAIADKEGIEVTDEEANALLEEDAALYGYETADEYKENIDVDAYKEYLLTMEVMDFLTENAVVVAE